VSAYLAHYVHGAKHETKIKRFEADGDRQAITAAERIVRGTGGKLAGVTTAPQEDSK
jgi:hypothetical protein